jgi:hypothetical protein
MNRSEEPFAAELANGPGHTAAAASRLPSADEFDA